MQIDTAYFKGRLEQERDQLQAELNRVLGENTENTDTDGQSFGVSNHPADAASDVMSRERNMAVIADMQFDLNEINHALERVAGGTYGLCEEDDAPIPIERLEARPAATYCVRHQRAREQV